MGKSEDDPIKSTVKDSEYAPTRFDQARLKGVDPPGNQLYGSLS